MLTKIIITASAPSREPVRVEVDGLDDGDRVHPATIGGAVRDALDQVAPRELDRTVVMLQFERKGS